MERGEERKGKDEKRVEVEAEVLGRGEVIMASFQLFARHG